MCKTCRHRTHFRRVFGYTLSGCHWVERIRCCPHHCCHRNGPPHARTPSSGAWMRCYCAPSPLLPKHFSTSWQSSTILSSATYTSRVRGSGSEALSAARSPPAVSSCTIPTRSSSVSAPASGTPQPGLDLACRQYSPNVMSDLGTAQSFVLQPLATGRCRRIEPGGVSTRRPRAGPPANPAVGVRYPIRYLWSRTEQRRTTSSCPAAYEQPGRRRTRDTSRNEPRKREIADPIMLTDLQTTVAHLFLALGR